MRVATRNGRGAGGAMSGGRAAPVAPVEIIDPHCVPVVPGHDLLIHTLPNGNILLTLVTHQVAVEGHVIGVVTCRVEWDPERLKEAHARLIARIEAGELATMIPANVLAG